MGTFEDAKAAMRVQQRLDEAKLEASRHCWYTVACEDMTVHCLIDASLDEARHRAKPLHGKYSARLDRAHGLNGQDHLHVFARSGELFAMNRDGSSHHSGPSVRIPSDLQQLIPVLYPGFTIPPGGIVEWQASPAWIGYLFD